MMGSMAHHIYQHHGSYGMAIHQNTASPVAVLHHCRCPTVCQAQRGISRCCLSMTMVCDTCHISPNDIPIYIYIIYTQYINFKIHCWWIYSRLEWWCRRLDSGRLAGRVLYIVSYSGFSQPKRKTRVQYNTIMPYHFYAHVHCPQIIGLTQHLPSPQPEQKHHWTTAFHGVTRDWAGASARDNSSQLITRWCLQDINWLINLANTYSIYIYICHVYIHIYIYTYFMCIYKYNVYIYMYHTVEVVSPSYPTVVTYTLGTANGLNVGKISGSF